MIRAAKPADLAAMRVLAESSPAAAQWSEERYRDLFRAGAPTRVALVAEEVAEEVARKSGGEVRGFVIALAAGDDWELENIAMAESSRRRGIATALLRALIARARESGAQSLFLEVRASNTAARALYGRLGFAERGRRPAYYQNPAEDAIIFALKILESG